MDRIELRVANGHVRIPTAEFDRLREWQERWMLQNQRRDLALLAALRLLKAYRNTDAALTIRFLDDENAHLWHVVQELLGDLEYLKAGLRGVLATSSLEDAQAVAGGVLGKIELMLVEDRCINQA